MRIEPATEGIAQWERAHFHTRLLWLLPLAFAFHILEESREFPSWVVGVLHGRFSSLVFYLANAWFMLVLLALVRLASHRRTATTLGLLFFFASGQTFWDAVFHVYAENHFGTYSPGYFTAVFLYLPLYAYLTYVALRERFLTPRDWFFALFAGIALLVFIIWGGLYAFSPIPWTLWV